MPDAEKRGSLWLDDFVRSELLSAVVGAVLAAWLGLATTGHGLGITAESPLSYTYDAHNPASVTTTAERGQPSTYDHHTTYPTVDRWSRGASARSPISTNFASAYAYADYNSRVRFAHVDGIGATTQQQARGDDSELSPPAPSDGRFNRRIRCGTSSCHDHDRGYAAAGPSVA